MHGRLAHGFVPEFPREEKWRRNKKKDWFALIAKTMIPNFELLHTDIYQPQTSACIVAYFFYNKLVKLVISWFSKEESWNEEWFDLVGKTMISYFEP